VTDKTIPLSSFIVLYPVVLRLAHKKAYIIKGAPIICPLPRMVTVCILVGLYNGLDARVGRVLGVSSHRSIVIPLFVAFGVPTTGGPRRQLK
jgi:hypothetical protein